MAIKSIEIKNFKSIDYLKINLSELNALVGRNGTGKSTIHNAIKYFYNNLVGANNTNDNFDTVNKLKETIEISVEYDLSKIKRYASENYSRRVISMVGFTNDCMTVTMKQKKNDPIVWNIDYDDRYIIYNSHPIYFCDTRFVDLTNWDSLWGTVGDLINAKDVNNIVEELYKKLDNREFKNFNEYENIFREFLESNEFTISLDSKKDRVISLLQLQLGGKNFLNKNERLEYFSDGTNSQSYILFLAYIAYEISNKRLKETTVFLDEPELGLHPKMIDQLMEKLVKYSSSVKFVIFSHSPRLVAAVVKGKGELYKVHLKHKYTKITKIVKREDKKYQLIITEREASCYFSNLILFVEGVSELELFTHPTLLNLFPFLKRIDVISTGSNDHVLKVFHSVNPKIPYVILNDMDKVLKFSEEADGQYRPKLKGLWYSPLKQQNQKDELKYSYARDLENRLKYTYFKESSKKRLELKNKIIDSLEEPLKAVGELKVMSDEKESIKSIQKFCSFYDLLLVRNTIEGTIINKSSYRIFNKWRKNMSTNEKLEALIRKSSKDERVVISRLLYSGKLDTLDKYTDDSSRVHKLISENKSDKNTGWISDFFDFYELNVIKQKQYYNDEKNKLRIQRFSQDFPELYDIIKVVKRKISDE